MMHSADRRDAHWTAAAFASVFNFKPNKRRGAGRSRSIWHWLWHVDATTEGRNRTFYRLKVDEQHFGIQSYQNVLILLNDDMRMKSSQKHGMTRRMNSSLNHQKWCSSVVSKFHSFCLRGNSVLSEEPVPGPSDHRMNFQHCEPAPSMVGVSAKWTHPIRDAICLLLAWM